MRVPGNMVAVRRGSIAARQAIRSSISASTRAASRGGRSATKALWPSSATVQVIGFIGDVLVRCDWSLSRRAAPVTWNLSTSPVRSPV